jgi:hypothetical protein
MQRSERVTRWLLAIAAAGALPCAGVAAAAEPQPYRYDAPIEIAKPAPFVELALPPAVYAHTMQGDLRDLRVVDSRGERVPFALLAPRAAPAASERVREATLYPLPQRPAGATAWPSPVEVTVEGDRISVRRSSASAAPSAATLRESPGWLIDLGEASPGDAAARRVQLRWSGPAEFSAAYAIETSADLRSWRAGPGGQLMALQSTAGALTQPIVALPDAAGRFVRLTWLDPATAPVLAGAIAVAPARDLLAFDAATELVFAPSAVPAGQRGATNEARGSLHFDLGGDLPLVDIDLRFASGTRVAPVRVQGRNRASEPWQELGSGVFYRLEREGTVAEAPAVAMPSHARFLRIVPDERAAALDPQQTRLVVRARLASLVFASSGDAPFHLLAGSPDARVGALPANTLVPQFDEERKRFGQATLGAFGEAPGVALAAEQSEREARLRPWLLWGVLVAGVIGLALLVWRLARSGPGASPPAA